MIPGCIKVVKGGSLEGRDPGIGQHVAELLDGGGSERAAAKHVDSAERVPAQAAVRDGRDVRQTDTGRYRKRSAKSERMKGKRLLDRGQVRHLLEGLGELDPGLGVDRVVGEAVGDKAYV